MTSQVSDGRRVLNDFTLGNWTATNTATHLEVKNAETGETIKIAPSQVSDLIIALMATNPTENPRLWATSRIGKHFDRSNSSVQRWFDAGTVPGTVVVEDTNYERRAMLSALVDLIELPKTGNPAWSSD